MFGTPRVFYFGICLDYWDIYYFSDWEGRQQFTLYQNDFSSKPILVYFFLFVGNLYIWQNPIF